MPYQKKFLYFLIFFVYCIIPISVDTTGYPIGATCTTDSQCITNDCEDSDLSGWSDDFCVCQTSEHCAKAYGGNASDWSCSDDKENDYHDLHYCKNKTNGKIYDPTKEKGQQKAFLIGDTCSDNAECVTGDCEDSDEGTDYCVCQTAQHCADAYGGQDSEWTCSDVDDDETNDLHYCQKKSTSQKLDPSKPEGKAKPAGAAASTNSVTVQTGVPLLNEIKLLLKKPQPRIHIPGLNFSDMNTDELITQENDGSTFLNLPFLGEYIAAIYQYGIIIVGIIGVFGLMIGGIMWMMSGGTADGKQRAIKYIKNSIIGIILTVTSYSILFLINPNLVNFQSLKILYVRGNPDFVGTTAETPNATAMNSAQPVVGGGKNQLDCSAYENSQKGRTACMKNCLAQLPANKRSQLADQSYNKKYLGKIDCNAKGTRNLSVIKYIAIHEGAPVGAIPWWWFLNITQGKIYGSHYFITKDGTIYQAGDERFKFSHGVKNDTAIGIDLQALDPITKLNCKKTGMCTYSDKQYDSLKKLINDIENRLGKKMITLGHCEVNSKGKASAHVDPRGFQWEKIGLNSKEHKRGKCLHAYGYPPGSLVDLKPKYE